MIGNVINSIRNFKKWWLLISIFLIIAIVSGGIIFGLKQSSGSNQIEIIPASATASNLEVSITGAVANEGFYTFSEDCSIGDILQAAGEITDGSTPTSIEIHISTTDVNLSTETQKININTAEAWLLDALPGIGPTLAQRIVEYRETEGPFKSIAELTNVNGIGDTTLENIHNNICVFD